MASFHNDQDEYWYERMVAEEYEYDRARNERDLRWAAGSGRLGTVRRLLFEGIVDVDAPDRAGGTALSYASGCGHVRVVRELIESEADIECPDKRHRTPLHHSITYRHAHVTFALIQGGADVESATEDKLETPLHYASQNGFLEGLEMLLEYGNANMEARDVYGSTPLHVAVAHRHVHAATALLERGAEADASDYAGRTPLHIASSDKNGLRAAVEELIDMNANVGATDEHGWTPLHQAVQPEIIRSLVTRGGADVNAQGHFGHTPLHIAVCFNRGPAVEELLARSALIDARDEEGRTPLHRAVQPEIIRTLVTRGGADVNAEDPSGRTPLHIASFFNHAPAVEELLARSAVIDARDESGRTPLHYASFSGQDKIVRILLERGARIDIRSKQGKTALALAKKEKKMQAIRVFHEFVTNRFDLVHWVAVDDGRLEKLQNGLEPPRKKRKLNE